MKSVAILLIMLSLLYITVAPDAMHHVKTYREDIKNMHCVAPEYGGMSTIQ